MIDALLMANERDDFVSAVRALDRALLSGFYVVPLFYVGDQWLAQDSRLRRPEKLPLLGTTIDCWWRADSQPCLPDLCCSAVHLRP